jgi:hypothetical protein
MWGISATIDGAFGDNSTLLSALIYELEKAMRPTMATPRSDILANIAYFGLNYGES